MVEGAIIGAIDRGYLILLGVGASDSDRDALHLADKVAHLRVFEDQQGKMNLSLINVGDLGAQALVVSQFTLYADTHKGRRPGFGDAMESHEASRLVEVFVSELIRLGVTTKVGRFGAKMLVRLENDGPVTILLESPSTANPLDQTNPSSRN